MQTRDHTKDDVDKEPHEERSCGRSQTSLYNGTRTHLALGKDAPFSRTVERAGQIVAALFSAGCTTNLSAIDFRQAQLGWRSIP
jgi:hypothetical protein